LTKILPEKRTERHVSKVNLSVMAREEYKAREIGVFVHDSMREGEIVSVHSRALNIRCRDGLLVSVVRDGSQMTSLSLTVPQLFQNSEACHRSLRCGEPARLEQDLVVINGLCIDLRDGEPWDGMISSEGLEGLTLHKLPLIKQALLSEGRKEGLLGIIGSSDTSDPFLRRSLSVLNRINFSGIEQRRIRGLLALIGLGKGFTPSGDDFIAGILLGEEIMRGLPRLGRKPCEIDKEEVRGGLSKTNDAGRTLLHLALRGHFPCYLTETVKGAAGARSFEQIRKAVSAAVMHGETSGTDALAGLVWYLGKSTQVPDGQNRGVSRKGKSGTRRRSG
jgi:hypothetical protein